MPQRQVFSIGYEGADLATFLATLSAVGVKQVIDIRELPLSRKRGFSKVALSSALREVGIHYLHFRELGDPKPGREAARSGDHAGFQRIYRAHLESAAAQAALVKASQIARNLSSCLLCFERNHEGCHRTIVADAMVRGTGLQVTHLRIESPISPSLRDALDPIPAHIW